MAPQGVGATVRALEFASRFAWLESAVADTMKCCAGRYMIAAQELFDF